MCWSTIIHFIRSCVNAMGHTETVSMLLYVRTYEG